MARRTGGLRRSSVCAQVHCCCNSCYAKAGARAAKADTIPPSPSSLFAALTLVSPCRCGRPRSPHVAAPLPSPPPWFQRAGMTPEDLNRLNVIHVAGTKGKVGGSGEGGGGDEAGRPKLYILCGDIFTAAGCRALLCKGEKPDGVAGKPHYSITSEYH